MSDLSTLVTYWTVLFGAGIYMSITGFGFGMISTTILFLVFDPHTVVHSLAFPFITATAFAFVQNRKDVIWADTLPYAALALPGVLFATWMHPFVPTFALQLFLALLLFYALFHASLPTFLRFLLRTPVSATLAGFANGILGTAGPPVIAWSVLKPWPPNVRRAATVSIFLVAGSFRTVALCFEPRFEVQKQLIHCLYVAPAIFLGVWLGHRLSGYLSKKQINILHQGGIFVLACLLLMKAVAPFVV